MTIPGPGNRAIGSLRLDKIGLVDLILQALDMQANYEDID